MILMRIAGILNGTVNHPSDFICRGESSFIKWRLQLQKLADNELDLLAISLPPGVGKTTLALFFLTWLGGRNPEKPILGGSHSNAFLRGVYDECLRIMDPQGDYLWHDVFPTVQVVKTNAQDMMLDLGTDSKKGKRFADIGIFVCWIRKCW